MYLTNQEAIDDRTMRIEVTPSALTHETGYRSAPQRRNAICVTFIGIMLFCDVGGSLGVRCCIFRGLKHGSSSSTLTRGGLAARRRRGLGLYPVSSSEAIFGEDRSSAANGIGMCSGSMR